MKRFLSICGLLITSCVFAENENIQLPELGEPVPVFGGLYVLGGVGYDWVSNKYEFKKSSIVYDGEKQQEKGKVIASYISENDKIDPSNGKISTSNISAFAGIGCGGLFEDKYYLGIDFEMFMKFNGNKKSKSCLFSSVLKSKGTEKEIKETANVTVKGKNAIGLTIKARLGYVIPGCGCMPYAVVGCERFQHSVKLDVTNDSSGFVTYGSFYPVVGVGLEKKLKNNWSMRGELVYAIGNWDDTGKYLKNKSESRVRSTKFRAKGNRLSFKLMLVKYI